MTSQQDEQYSRDQLDRLALACKPGTPSTKVMVGR
jgi:hypothetical protein